jgi:hypothetical protein
MPRPRSVEIVPAILSDGLRQCPQCLLWFAVLTADPDRPSRGRRDRVYCSATCRTLASRDRVSISPSPE